jgi:hypothetical protein
MNPWLSDCLLLAEKTRLDEIASRMGDGFRGDAVRPESSNMLLSLAIVVMLLVLWGLLTRLTPSHVRRAPRSRPWRLFVSLCRAHRLRWRETWLLWRLARLERLPEPALVFLQPQRFEPDGLPAPLCRHRAKLASLRARLFAGLEEREPEGSSAAGPDAPLGEKRSPAASPAAEASAAGAT